jgi:transposase
MLRATATTARNSRWFWGMRLHLLAAPDGTPRAAILASADQKERDVALRLLPIGLRGGETIIADKGYAGREFEQTVAERFGSQLVRPRRADEPGQGPHLAPIRQCIESLFWVLKDRLGLERHRARTLIGLRSRIASKLLALAAGSGSTIKPADPHAHSPHSPPNPAWNQSSSRATRGAMGVNERARQVGRRTRFCWQRAASGQRPTQERAAPRGSISVAGIDDEVERTQLNDRSIATNHSADSPAYPLRG